MHTSRPRLLPARPNPFNPRTMIRAVIPEGREPVAVTLCVFDVHGRLVRTLREGVAPPGVLSVAWGGERDDGTFVGSGVYFCSLLCAGRREVQKITLLK